MDRSDDAESQKTSLEYVYVKDYRIDKKAIQDKQTEMLTVLIIRIAP